MNRKITITGANIVFFIFACVFVVYQVLAVIIFGSEIFTDKILYVVLINEFLIVLPPVIIYTIKKKADFKETFRIKKIKPLHAATVVLLSITAYPVAMMLNNIVVFLLQFIGKIPTQNIPVPKNLSELTVGILVIAVSPAICEEMLHRGLLLSAYERRGSMKAVVFTAIFFGVFHFDITNLFGPIFLGLMIGFYVIRTNSIFAGMLAHFVNNAISEILQYLYRNSSTSETVAIAPQEIGQIILLGLAGIILTALLLKVFIMMTKDSACIIPPISNIKKDIKSVFTHWPIILVFVLYFLLTMLTILSMVAMKFLQ